MATLVAGLPSSAIALTDKQFAPQFEHPVTSSAALTESREQSFTIFSRANDAYKVVVKNSPLPTWVKPTISAFIDLQNLDEGWDSYGGKAISRDLIQQSVSILGIIMQPNSPVPSVVPMADGGIQLEWHRQQQDLEIVFPWDEAPQFSYRNRSTGAESQGFATEIDALIRLISGLL